MENPENVTSKEMVTGECASYSNMSGARRKEEKLLKTKMQQNGHIDILRKKWGNRRINNGAKKLQQASDNNNMIPHWAYRNANAAQTYAHIHTQHRWGIGAR